MVSHHLIWPQEMSRVFPLLFADEGLLQAPRDGDRGAAPGHRRGAEVPQDGRGVHGLLRRRRTHAQVLI